MLALIRPTSPQVVHRRHPADTATLAAQTITGHHATGEIDFDLPCARCAYNLRGLRAGGRCPECADPIDRALAHAGFDFAPLAWIIRIHRAVWLLSLAGAFISGSEVLGALVPQPMSISARLLIGAAQVVAAALASWSVYLLTCPGPTRRHETDRLLTRTALRFIAAASILLYLYRSADSGGLLLGIRNPSFAMVVLSGATFYAFQTVLFLRLAVVLARARADEQAGGAECLAAYLILIAVTLGFAALAGIMVPAIFVTVAIFVIFVYIVVCFACAGLLVSAALQLGRVRCDAQS